MTQAVPHATEGLFCTTAPGAAVSHATLGLFCTDIEIPDLLDRGQHTYDAFNTGMDYLALAHQEDEDLLLIARAFIEIIKCR